MKLKLIFLTLLSAATMSAQKVILDENFDDWKVGVTMYSDPRGDQGITGIDITQVRMYNDDLYYYLYVDISTPINIQSGNSLALLIDIDDSINTGLSRSGLGVDLIYNFGNRRGIGYANNRAYTIFHSDIGLVTAPTVTSERFEICIARDVTFGSIPLRIGNQIKVLISDESALGDKAPNGTGGYAYSMITDNVFAPEAINLKKIKASDLRIVAYNVLRDNLFKPNTQASFNRIFNALKPDIIGFCEIYDQTSQQTADIINTYLPTSGSSKWYNSGVNPDIIVISKYPVINTARIDGNGAFLIDVDGKEIVFIVVHFPCCDNETARQAELDNLMAFVRNIRFGTSIFRTAQNTPIIIAGDTNLVGLSEQQNTLLNGDIKNNNTYGADFYPDWDDTPLEDVKPLTTRHPSTFTWYNPNGSYSAGRLDYITYTGSVIKVINNYSLFTPTLTNQELIDNGLEAEDVIIASDHLPIVADFEIAGSVSVKNLTDRNQLEVYYDGQSINVTLGNIMTDRPDSYELFDMNGRSIAHGKIDTATSEFKIKIDSILPQSLYIIKFNFGYAQKSFNFINY